MKTRLSGPPIILSTALTLAIEVTVANGGGTYTTTGAWAPYETIAAGEYSIFDFADLVAQKIAAYLFADFNAAGSLPTITGSAATIFSQFSFTSSPTRDGCRFRFDILQLNTSIGGNPAPITACKLKNTASPAFPALLGLGTEGTDVTCTVSVGIPFANGLFCPRAINCSPRSEVYSSPRVSADIYTHQKLSNGEIKVWSIASQHAEQDYEFVDMDSSLTGGPFHVGNLSSIDSDRLTINFPNPTLTNRLSGTGQHGLQVDRIVSGGYIYIPSVGNSGYVSRVRQVTTSIAPTTHKIVLCEKLPQIVAGISNAPVYIVGDLWAAKFDARTRAKGHWLLFGANDTDGSSRFTPEQLVLIGDGQRFVDESLRRDLGMDRYTISMRCARPAKPYLTQVLT